MVSAVKIGGKRLYKLARKGIAVDRKPRVIRINTLRLINFVDSAVNFMWNVQRELMSANWLEDMGRALGCGACITQIERTKVGDFAIEQAVKLRDLKESHVQSWRD